MTEGENIVAWTPCPPPHTHTFLLAQQNTHTKSLKGLNYYRHAHILEHTQTKAGRHTQSLSLMATGWRWWDHQRDQKPPDNIFVQEHATIHSHTHTFSLASSSLFTPSSLKSFSPCDSPVTLHVVISVDWRRTSHTNSLPIHTLQERRPLVLI